MLQMRRKLRNSLLVLPAVLLLWTSCGEKKPVGVLPPERLEAILYDYHLAQVMVSDMPSAERYKKDLYFDYVYDKHGVTQAQMDSSLVYYARYPKALSQIYINLSLRLERDLQRLENLGQQVIARTPIPVVGDSADLWYDARLKLFNSSPLTNHLAFTIPNDTNFKVNDRFEWSGEAVFLHDKTDSLKRYLQLALTAEFANDSLVSVDTVLYDSGPFVLHLTDTAGLQLSKLYGNVFYKNNGLPSTTLLHDIRLIRYRYVEPSDTLRLDSINCYVDSVDVENEKKLLSTENKLK